MTDEPDDSEKWSGVGRMAVAREVESTRYDVESALYALSGETMMQGGDPDAEDVQEARRALNRARRILEESVAPVAGCESWGDPVPNIPQGRAWEIWPQPDGSPE